jgi:hypothetical protein
MLIIKIRKHLIPILLFLRVFVLFLLFFGFGEKRL